MYMITIQNLSQKLKNNEKEWNETLEKLKMRYLTVFEKVGFLHFMVNVSQNKRFHMSDFLLENLVSHNKNIIVFRGKHVKLASTGILNVQNRFWQSIFIPISVKYASYMLEMLGWGIWW